MTRSLLTALVLFTLGAQAAEKPVTTTISAVKVFLSGAEVTRNGKVELPKGTSTLVFAGLSEEVDPSNIQVSGTGAFTILGVQHRLNYLEEKQDRAEVLVLKDRIKTLEADIERENSLLAVVEKEDARLGKNEVVGGEQGLTLTQLQSINEYLRGRQEALAMKRLEIKRTVDSLNEQLAKVKLQLAQVQGKKTRPTSEVVVEVSANTTVSATLTLKYMVSSAGWSPSYDIRVADITKPMQLTYKAQVYQSTGEDWDKVQLALSSGEPNKDAIMPTLYPWRLDFGRPKPAPVANVQPGYNPNVRDVRGIIRDAKTGEPLPFVNVVLSDANGQMINGTTSNIDGYYAIAIPANGRALQFTYVGYTAQQLAISNGTMNVNLAESSIQLSEVAIITGGVPASYRYMDGVQMKSKQRIRGSRSDTVDMYGLFDRVEVANTSLAESVTERATSFEFSISVPYTIPSDGKNHQVGVKEQELVSSYKYFCIPKLDLDAFLFAQVTGWEGLNLLAGPAFIYFEGTYVGESLLDLAGVNDTLDISLGRDKGVTVQRTKRKDYSQRQVVGNKRTESVGWEISVRNNKAQPIELVISDQFPVAVRSEIEVKLDDNGGASVNTEKGFLTWKERVEPRTSKQLRFGYSVKVPKDRMVVLE
ncbi:MAG: mucoidy inhibitor MuiA family protein [Flavobacteriales bacterium]|nr:mucoidy inhibitor MuiA family protein [Flavobacteriales bacterium]